MCEISVKSSSIKPHQRSSVELPVTLEELGYITIWHPLGYDAQWLGFGRTNSEEREDVRVGEISADDDLLAPCLDASWARLVIVRTIAVENVQNLGQMLYVIGRVHPERFDGYILFLVRPAPDVRVAPGSEGNVIELLDLLVIQVI